ncbi:oleate hydratase [Propionimicrobium sp. PCR01-08-3]|uniref:oleate hydratase n=1 Tax=Propionimicrobium sp. PCR01-08-3 TaxID=3052086 RepID=UPI00255CD450|nr:oleate hydratase [Propionimicrobium sp. PCR01-08-3]WIY81718.1 oleate hydratase [Propionimicrobium sp. PCR01-08-3]
MTSKAYMIGTGIGNLAAACYLIRDGGWEGSQITMLGLDTHGANDGAAAKDFEDEYGHEPLSNSEGFLNRGGRMLNEETYENFWDLMSSVPSLDQPGKSITEEILDFDHAHPTKDIGRLIDSTGLRTSGPNGYRHMQFTNKQRYLLTKLMMMPESRESELDNISIRDWFAETPDFFTTNFWWMWQTTFAFKDVSSVAELRRYMNRMILEFSRINTLEGVTRTPYNQYESVILPLRAFLKDKGVTFINNRKVTEFTFADTPMRDEIIVTGLKYEEVDNGNAEGVIEIGTDDLVFDTNGSITDSTSIGDMDTAIVEDERYAPSAQLWKQAAGRFYNLGNPDKFFNDRTQSEWTSFTITTSDHRLINEVSRLTRQLPGNALNTFVESGPLISLVVHHQPHYHAQTPEQGVFWGYALYPRRHGDFIDKPFIEMTGREMLLETLGHLGRIDDSADPISNHTDELMDTVINVVPAHMPYASALFNRRSTLDRPKVVPDGSKNLAFISQFAEMPFDMVFTEQYSVRCAQVGVYQLLGLDKPLTKMHHYEKDPKVLAKAAHVMFR